jgi:S1-C subfamily serine protease
MRTLTGIAALFMVLISEVVAQPPWGSSPSGPQLGVRVEEIPLGRLDALQLPYGVRITWVLPGSPAHGGALQAGDIITEIDAQPVFSVPRLRWLVEKSAHKEGLEVTYRRNGREASVNVALPALAPPADQRQVQQGWVSPGYLGVALQSLTAGLREAFSVPAGVGVLIAEVYPGTPAAQSRLRAGDVIVRMDRRTIREISDVRRVLDYFEPGEELVVEVIRDGNTQQLTVTLGERDVLREPAARRAWPRGGSDMQPFFDPGWWQEIERFLQRWQEYFEERPSSAPQVALGRPD